METREPVLGNEGMRGWDRKVSRTWMIWSLILLLGTAGCSPADTSLERVRRGGVLRIGLDPTYPPFENGDTGDLHGLDIDLAREIAAELEVEAVFVYYGYDGLYDALLTSRSTCCSPPW